jgi:copper(I)-binding protein
MRRVALLLAGVLAAGGGATAAPDGDGPSVEDAWIRAAPPVAEVMAGYLTLRAGGTAIEVVAAACEGFGRVEIHESVVVDDVATMRPLATLPLAAGASRRFAPGGLHLMLLEPARIPAVGEDVACRLELAAGDPIDFTAPVRRSVGEDDHAHHHHH